VVAKLDRLSRDVEHIFRMLRALGDHFKSCDLPSSDSLTLSIFAGLAQREREIISIRTRQALKAKKAQGMVLGKPENFTHEGRKAGAAVRKEQARLNPVNTRAASMIQLCKGKGMSFEQIALELNRNGFRTVRGKEYQKATVKMLWGRVGI
jgi:DNA invertase Pin-like site-specific DNA recombinase